MPLNNKKGNELKNEPQHRWISEMLGWDRSHTYKLYDSIYIKFKTGKTSLWGRNTRTAGGEGRELTGDTWGSFLDLWKYPHADYDNGFTRHRITKSHQTALLWFVHFVVY